MLTLFSYASYVSDDVWGRKGAKEYSTLAEKSVL